MTETSRPNFKHAAEGQLFFARMARLQDNSEAANAHFELADTYIKQELNRERDCG